MPKLTMFAPQASPTGPTVSPADCASQEALSALYVAALGHGAHERYLRRFAQFDAAGRTSPGWNGAASLCTLSWAVLRKLWVPTLLYVAVLEGLALLALGPGRWLLQAQPQLQWPLLGAGAALVWVLPGMYGDALLHTEIRKRIVTAVTQTQSVAEACIFLGHTASSPQRRKTLVWANVCMALAAAAALYVWLPWGSAAPFASTLPASARLARPADPEVTVNQAPTPVHGAGTAAPDPMREAEAAPLAKAVAAVEPGASAPTPDKAAPVGPASTSTQPAAPGMQPGYYLNAGLFAQEANARRVQAQLLNANLPAFRQPLDTAQGQRIRVRVGPFGTRQEATAARTTLRGMALQAEVFQQ